MPSMLPETSEAQSLVRPQFTSFKKYNTIQTWPAHTFAWTGLQILSQYLMLSLKSLPLSCTAVEISLGTTESIQVTHHNRSPCLFALPCHAM